MNTNGSKLGNTPDMTSIMCHPLHPSPNKWWAGIPCLQPGNASKYRPWERSRTTVFPMPLSSPCPHQNSFPSETQASYFCDFAPSLPCTSNDVCELIISQNLSSCEEQPSLSPREAKLRVSLHPDSYAPSLPGLRGLQLHRACPLLPVPFHNRDQEAYRQETRPWGLEPGLLFEK